MHTSLLMGMMQPREGHATIENSLYKTASLSQGIGTKMTLVRDLGQTPPLMGLNGPICYKKWLV